jgi:hypothetical protein
MQDDLEVAQDRRAEIQEAVERLRAVEVRETSGSQLAFEEYLQTLSEREKLFAIGYASSISVPRSR